MSIEFEERGKIFTNVVTKQSTCVHIQTSTHLIIGKYHVQPGVRIKDELDKDEGFIALTDAVIYDLTGKTYNRCDFIAINRQHIVWLFQENNSKDAGENI